MNFIQRLKANRQLKKDADTFFQIQVALGEYFTLVEEELAKDPTFRGFVGCSTEIRTQECPVFYFNSVSRAYEHLPNEYTEHIADFLNGMLDKRKDLTLTQLLAEPLVALIFEGYLFFQNPLNRLHILDQNGTKVYRVGPAEQ